MKFLFIGVLWLLVAIALGLFGLLWSVRPPGPQIFIVGLTGWVIASYWVGKSVCDWVAALHLRGIVGLTGWLIASYWLGKSFRDWLTALDLRAIVALHLTRLVGLYFLWLYGRGELPYRFAVPGGWGDIIVATAAAIILATWSMFGR